MTSDLAVIAARKVGHVVVRPCVLPSAAEAELMAAAEVVVDSQIQLVAIEVGPHSESIVSATPAAYPCVMSPIQSIMWWRKVVRQRHPLENTLHEWIKAAPIWIPRSKHAVDVSAE